MKQAPSGGESFATLLGNDGMFNYSEISGAGSTSEGHEIGHGLGLKHNNFSPFQVLIPGKPDLMDLRGDKVQDKYKSKYSLPNGTLNPNKREVSQKNINNIFTPEIIKSLDANGNATIGTTSNTYYTTDGKEVRKP